MQGLLSTHTFFRWALKESKLNYTRLLFAGRMTFDDPFRLEPFVNQGLIGQPIYLPPWLQQSKTLAAYLAFSIFSNKIRIESFEKSHDLGNKTVSKVATS